MKTIISLFLLILVLISCEKKSNYIDSEIKKDSISIELKSLNNNNSFLDVYTNGEKLLSLTAKNNIKKIKIAYASEVTLSLTGNSKIYAMFGIFYKNNGYSVLCDEPKTRTYKFKE